MQKFHDFHFSPLLDQQKVELPAQKVFFLFNLGETIKVNFNEHYTRSLTNDHFQIIFHPNLTYNFHIISASESALNGFYFCIDIGKLHELLTDDPATSTLIKKTFTKPYHYEQSLSLEIRNVAEQILTKEKERAAKILYLHAKFLELLSLLFSPKDKIDYQLCPFLKDSRNVEIIKKAKSILLENLNQNITIEKLSREIGMNEHNLKLGFKEIYGTTIHQFISQYKLNQAKNQLLSGNFQIQEIAENLGYKNTSHFIGSFKKKFGHTPKQYLLQN